MIALLVSAALAATPATWFGPRPPAHPRRVATLAPSLTELVVALGAGDRLVGVSRYDDAPEVNPLPRLGGLMDPSAESILAVKPDLFVVQPSPTVQPVYERLADLGVPVLELSLSNVADVEAAERELGKALGVPEKGEALATALEQRLQRARAEAAKRPHPRVLVVYGWEPLVVAGPGSFADEILRACGGINAATLARSAYATYSAEAAAAARPELILDLSFEDKMPASFKSLPGLGDARVAKPHSLALLHPGPRLVEGVDEVEALLRTGRSPAGP